MSAKIIVTGRMTRDLEKTSDKAPYKFGVAVDGLVKEGSEYKTKFYNCTFWDAKDDGTGGTPALDLVKRLQGKGKTLTKGSMVQVTGTPSYEVVTKDGVTTTYDGIKVTDIEFISTGNRAESSTGVSTEGANTSGQGSIALDSEEDVPLL